MSRELDAELHAVLFNVPIEWRLCATDPECGNWEDVQWHDEPHQEGDDLWGHPVVRQPCYNWLDTDEPARRGWTAENVASDEYRAHRWRVVPFYSTDIADAWQVVERMAEARDAYFDIQRGFGSNWYAARFCVPISKDDPRSDGGLYGNWQYDAEAQSAPMAICLAALKSVAP